MDLNRRGVILGLGALFAAPAIIRPGILMPVKNMIVPIRNQITYWVTGVDEFGAMMTEIMAVPSKFLIEDMHGERMFAKMAAAVWVADNTSLRTLHKGHVEVNGKEVDHWGHSWYSSPSSG